jgi:hypothetical protein
MVMRKSILASNQTTLKIKHLMTYSTRYCKNVWTEADLFSHRGRIDLTYGDAVGVRYKEITHAN